MHLKLFHTFILLIELSCFNNSIKERRTFIIMYHVYLYLSIYLSIYIYIYTHTHTHTQCIILYFIY